MTTYQRMTTRFNKEMGVMANVHAGYKDGKFSIVRVTITDTDAHEVVGVKYYSITKQTEAIAFADSAIRG